MNRRIVLRILALALLAVPGGGGVAHAQEARVVRVACAASMRFAFEEIKAAFMKQNEDIEVRATYGSSGNFFAQLSNRAPFDFYLSADVEYPRRLVEKGLADPESEFVYGVGQIVIWVPESSSIDVEKLGMKALLDPSIRKIAIGNPRYAPYGRAAVAAMKTFGVYETVRDRLVRGDSILQAAQFVESGAADIGIISHSLTLHEPLQGRGRAWEVPHDAHPPIEQGAVILTWAADRAAADALRAFVRGSDGKAILQKFGFKAP